MEVVLLFLVSWLSSDWNSFNSYPNNWSEKVLKFNVSLQTSLQFSFQCSIPEAPLAPDNFHDYKNDHWVSSFKLDYMCSSMHTTTCPYFCLCAVYFCWLILFYFACTLSSTVALLQLISRGSPMSFEDSNRIIPLFYLFSSLFSHSLISVHDSEFFGHEMEGMTLFLFFSFALGFKTIEH